MTQKALLPWALPGVLIVAVLLGAVIGSVLVGIAFILLGYVGVPMAYLAYTRTRQELRDADAPTGPARRSPRGRRPR